MSEPADETAPRRSVPIALACGRLLAGLQGRRGRADHPGRHGAGRPAVPAPACPAPQRKREMTSPRLLAGGLLVVIPVVFMAGFTGLQMTFGYPEILRHPAREVLARFAAGGVDLHPVPRRRRRRAPGLPLHRHLDVPACHAAAQGPPLRRAGRAGHRRRRRLRPARAVRRGDRRARRRHQLFALGGVDAPSRRADAARRPRGRSGPRAARLIPPGPTVRPLPTGRTAGPGPCPTCWPPAGPSAPG